MARKVYLPFNSWSAPSEDATSTLNVDNATLEDSALSDEGMEHVEPCFFRTEIESAARRNGGVPVSEQHSHPSSLLSSPDTSASSSSTFTPFSNLSSAATTPPLTPITPATGPANEVPDISDDASSNLGLGIDFPTLAEAAAMPNYRPAHVVTSFQAQKPKKTPIVGKIYFLSCGKHLTDSVIWTQNSEAGFFNHPVLITEVEEHSGIVYFYSCTSARPTVIRELDMALRIGTTSSDEGPGVLRLQPESNPMAIETWVNLEQRYWIEFKALHGWDVDVRVDLTDLTKLDRRIAELEADQNRFIYKPLPRPMSSLEPGTVVMIPNGPTGPTLGTPVVILQNNYPEFNFLRIRRFDDNVYFSSKPRACVKVARDMCLAISKDFRNGHEGTPVMFVEPDSPEMREDSYIEIYDEGPKTGDLERCKTWCWPPVKISTSSLVKLHEYMAGVALQNAEPATPPPSPTPTEPAEPAQPKHQHVQSAYHGPVQHAQMSYYGSYHQPPTGYIYNPQWLVCNTAIMPPQHFAYMQAGMAQYQPGYYAPKHGAHSQHYPGCGCL